MLARPRHIGNVFARSHCGLRTSLEAKSRKELSKINVLSRQRYGTKAAHSVCSARSKIGHTVASKQTRTRFIITTVVVGLVLGGSLSSDYLSRAVDRAAAQLVGPSYLRSSYQSGSWPQAQDVDVDPPLVMSVPALPGRPGNLTPDQQVKLQEFWLATLRLFGVHPDHDGDEVVDSKELANPSSSTGPGQRQDIVDAGQDKKRKNRLSMFGRKNQKEAGESSTEHKSAMPSTPQLVDGDDKYGQAKEFRHAIASQTPEDLRNAFWGMVKHDHPDGLLLRFLRARKWDVEKALIMLISTMHWRSHEMHVDDDIIKSGEGGAIETAKHANGEMKKEGDDFLAQLRMGKSFLHGVDKEGRPMCFVRVRLHRQGEQSEASLERYTVYVIETARLFLTASVDTAAIVFDMTGFSMANMDYTPVKFMIKCFEANYPESLGIVIVHKSPWIFQGIWSIIRGWLDPIVASKVHFTKNVEELQHFVPRNHIPKELGWEEDWAYHYVEPTADENERMSNQGTRKGLLRERETICKGFETTTLAWVGKSVISDEFRELQKQRDSIADDIRNSYWRIDPYIRARTLYDRLGIIDGSGQIQPYLKVNQIDKKLQLSSSSHKTSVDDLD